MPPWLPSERGVPLQRALDLAPGERQRLVSWLAADDPLPADAVLKTPVTEPLQADVVIDIPAHTVHGECVRPASEL